EVAVRTAPPAATAAGGRKDQARTDARRAVVVDGSERAVAERNRTTSARGLAVRLEPATLGVGALDEDDAVVARDVSALEREPFAWAEPRLAGEYRDTAPLVELVREAVDFCLAMEDVDLFADRLGITACLLGGILRHVLPLDRGI